MSTENERFDELWDGLKEQVRAHFGNGGARTESAKGQVLKVTPYDDIPGGFVMALSSDGSGSVVVSNLSTSDLVNHAAGTLAVAMQSRNIEDAKP